MTDWVSNWKQNGSKTASGRDVNRKAFEKIDLRRHGYSVECLVLRNQTSITQWIPVCGRSVPVPPIHGQWGRMLSGTSQWPQMSQSMACGGSEQIAGIDEQLSRKYHTTNKLLTTKDSPQPVEEKVGAFTKLIEAMGFTGPLKCSKWKIKIAALRMYTSCVEKTDFEEFFLRIYNHSAKELTLVLT
ncbi:PREDICTED: ubiquinol-cytochrome-c reductase complex assembly factor 1-like [Chrysochloris asiatica]|uniref:Ubiquinol-cytochrome-c reductase complex assembly factor 1-like n=1 Tax=Chrysochloris asiatica TaxID=185453 RepID=A0A9B0TPP0_CHRAS|nr:PREDICTED: ubiquinol-cytochrome-c reductase complex assembly factor 1-like [Chrysochloris asiatica]